jgi:NADH dehydrogenase FAD-containing subunit
MKQLAVSAQSENVDHTTIDADMQKKVEQIEAIIAASQFNGANLLATDVDGAGATGVDVLASVLVRLAHLLPLRSQLPLLTSRPTCLWAA